MLLLRASLPVYGLGSIISMNETYAEAAESRSFLCCCWPKDGYGLNGTLMHRHIRCCGCRCITFSFTKMRERALKVRKGRPGLADLGKEEVAAPSACDTSDA
jgi:hypothetical protein